jgi:carbon monoxide dehydrogenase subunit G
MDIEKTLNIAAPAERVWALLLDPKVMGECVPGMQSIEVISDVEYVSVIQVKIAFVSARFNIKTTITEQRPPHYLRSEGTGQDASVASSLKQISEIFLTQLPDGSTELRMTISVDVLGRLGTFGLNVMKTKADRMWDEFAVKLQARLSPVTQPVAQEAIATAQATTDVMPTVKVAHAAPAIAAAPIAARSSSAVSWWSRLFASPAAPLAHLPSQRELTDICIEVRRSDTTISVRWPIQSANECGQWLQQYLK